MSKEKQIGIKVVTYEEQRLKYFSDLLKKAQARYKRLVRKHKDAHYLSDEFQKISDVSGEICFLEEVVDMLEYGYLKRSEGEWHYNPDGMDWGLGAWQCSLCGCRNDNLPMDKNIKPLRWAGSKYCPNCGAKMKGGGE